jgi:hypothetical protein
MIYAWASLLFSLAAAAAQEKGKDKDKDKASSGPFTRCHACHAVPDPVLRWDQTWSGLVQSSPCVGPVGDRKAQEERSAILAWLQSPAAVRLTRIDAETPAPAGCAFVTVDFEEGYLLLVPDKADLLSGRRLSWKRTDDVKRRPLEPGTYQIRRYVVARDDSNKTEWTVQGTGLGRKVVLRAGEETKIKIDTDVAFDAQSLRKGARVTAGGLFTGDGGMGVSVFQRNERIPIGWKVTDGKQDLAGAGCTYGPQGVFEGGWDAPVGTPRALKAKLTFATGPFRLKGDPLEHPVSLK